jgi:Flp pilus assembly pilin Flp
MMASILRLLEDERSAIAIRHARLASLYAGAGVAAGIFLTVAGNTLHQGASQRVLWALADGLGPLAG